MLQNAIKSPFPFLTALLIGGIGAVGQASLLYHELADCYPYKVVDYAFYKGIADIGLYLSPLIAIIAGFALGLKKHSLAIILPVVSCPLVFAVVFKAVSLIRELNGVVPDWKFDGKTPSTAAQDFFTYSLSLTVTGLVVGVISALILSFLLKPKKLV
ncbi:MAG TPA: hypothetical protein VIL74_08505 [Pyrinomonadaceae bacterium]|jgi:hypothetical protein